MITFRFKIVTLLALIVTFTSQPSQSAIFYDWPIGREREVDEGVYFTVVKVESGWRIWKLETKSGVECRAVKSAVGRAHPIPVGVGSAFFRGTPFLMIWHGYNDQLRFTWEAEHSGKAKIQYRQADAKFWTSGSMSEDDLTPFDGKRVEVSLTSWEYPELLVGYSKEGAVMDFTGLKSAILAIESCKAR